MKAALLALGLLWQRIDCFDQGYRQRVSLKGPLADSYWSAVALVLMALTPFLVLSSAVFPMQEMLVKGTGLSEGGLELTNGMADAGYCFGTVLAVQLLQRLPARRVLLVLAALFVAASVPAAWAAIAAVPPLIVGWDVVRLRPTAVRMNLAIFGAIFFTRFVPAMAFSGLLMVVVAGVILTGVATGDDAIVLVGSGVLGVGVGGSVSPALFSTGFSLPSQQLPRIFALVELLRGAAAFLAAAAAPPRRNGRLQARCRDRNGDLGHDRDRPVRRPLRRRRLRPRPGCPATAGPRALARGGGAGAALTAARRRLIEAPKSASAEAPLEPLEGAPPAVVECGVLDRRQHRAVVVVELVAHHRRFAVEVNLDDPRQHQIGRAAEPDLAGPGDGFDVRRCHGIGIPMHSTR